ncbi:hypothetical protein LCGC14_0434690 [marine sediment metagenome]|uniref:Uncharacterized protein n=1 Tax=marine sediment metagenome TaxID=412755 RepID=A0A0F9T532_9ZZZZ
MPNLKGKKNTNYKHGKSGTQLYKIWGYMMTRCCNKNSSNYKHYGGRGIEVCKRWLKFENFYKDMHNSYEVSHSNFGKVTIDRVDNNKRYSLSNCRWTTQREQNRNKRSNLWHTYNGVSLILADWAKIFKIPLSTLWERIYKISMPFEEAIVY